eukprot:524242-Pelagomonas_calceolata.AAC.6
MEADKAGSVNSHIGTISRKRRAAAAPAAAEQGSVGVQLQGAKHRGKRVRSSTSLPRRGNGHTRPKLCMFVGSFGWCKYLAIQKWVVGHWGSVKQRF